MRDAEMLLMENERQLRAVAACGDGVGRIDTPVAFTMSGIVNLPVPSLRARLECLAVVVSKSQGVSYMVASARRQPIRSRPVPAARSILGAKDDPVNC